MFATSATARGDAYGSPRWLNRTGPQQQECRRLLATLEGMGLTTIVRRHDPGEIVYWGPEPSDGLCVVVEGVMKVSERHPGGGETTLRLLGK